MDQTFDDIDCTLAILCVWPIGREWIRHRAHPDQVQAQSRVVEGLAFQKSLHQPDAAYNRRRFNTIG